MKIELVQDKTAAEVEQVGHDKNRESSKLIAFSCHHNLLLHSFTLPLINAVFYARLYCKLIEWFLVDGLHC